jgi:hypothetical protein
MRAALLLDSTCAHRARPLSEAKSLLISAINGKAFVDISDAPHR